ncbi:MAG: hypothetical protein NXI12_03460 [Alphaproteobacteria bacterium]|nr:hypothetical protein [Alphaproteobacteria bacterium]
MDRIDDTGASAPSDYAGPLAGDFDDRFLKRISETVTAGPDDIGQWRLRREQKRKRTQVTRTLQAIGRWTWITLVTFAVGVVGTVLEYIDVTPVLFERALGCSGANCPAVVSVSLADILSAGLAIVGLLASGVGLLRVRHLTVIKLKTEHTTSLQESERADAFLSVFIGSRQLQIGFGPEGIGVMAGNRRLSLPWNSVNASALADPEYNQSPPPQPDEFGVTDTTFARVTRPAERSEEEDAFHAAVSAWCENHDTLNLPLHRPPPAHENTALSEADRKAGLWPRESLTLRKRFFRAGGAGLSWDDAVALCLLHAALGAPA